MIPLESLKRIVQDIPPLPDMVVRLISMCQDSTVAPKEIVELIRHEPSITTKVLRLCNSPYYGIPRNITSLQEAVVYIGTDALVNFVLAGCLGTYYNDENQGYGLDRGDMWRHAVGVAICSEKIAEKVNPAMANQAFTCGLLHDIGKIILNTFVAEEFSVLNETVERDGLSFIEAEKKILGFTHSQVGAEIAQLWNLPKEIVESIRYHHEPANAKEHPELVAIVHVGNILCISFGIGIGADGLAYRFNPSSLELLNLEVNDLFDLSVDFHDSFKKATDFLTLN